ncbi:MAG: hypothetical protein J0L92_07950 [Deltaproteobacteria bacterium]|nr:hypothetical protein [Deltaproteobacteria bacterium]
MCVRRWFALVLVVLSMLPAATQAQDASADAQLAAIREDLRHAGFRSAAAAVDTYLQRTDLTATQRNQALEIDAIVSLARRDEARATRSLSTLYTRDPGHRLSDPDASPVVQGAFARAREAATPSSVSIETTSAAYLGRSEPLVSLRIGEGLDRVHELRVSVRLRGTPRFTALVVQPETDGTASTTLPLGADPGVQAFEVYVEALAPSGASIGTLGSATEPLQIEVAAAAPVVAQVVPPTELEEEETPRGGGGDVTGEWWFWTLIGVVVVGAGVGVGVGVAVSQPRSPDGTLGNVNLPLVTF